MTKSRRLLMLLAAFLIVATAVTWRLTHQNQASADAVASTAPIPLLSQSAGSEPPAPSVQPSAATRAPSASTAAAAGQCSSTVSFAPTHFAIKRLNISVRVVPVNEKSSNGTMAPPLDQPWEVAWIDTTNKPGSTSPGVIDLTAHTYHAGGAIGNTSTRRIR